MKKEYLNNDLKTFKSKSSEVKKLLNETLYILDCFGIPLDKMTPRRKERMAIAFLAVGDVKEISDFNNIKDSNNADLHSPKTRQIIEFVNKHFQENISSGSYDDIRRKDLKLLVLGDIVLKSSPNSATNDSTRGYVVNPFYADLIRKINSSVDWVSLVKTKLKDVESVGERLAAKRDLIKIPVKLPSGKELQFSSGIHNELQKAIIEEFLPRFGYGAEVLYVGDTADKYLHLDKGKLNELNFFDLSHDELPDVVAYSKDKNWLFLIEAYHSTGHIDQTKYIQFEKLTKECIADIVYVTAFSNRDKFRGKAQDIAWETEVWIADNPDHMIHFNGDKFLGPYHIK